MFRRIPLVENTTGINTLDDLRTHVRRLRVSGLYGAPPGTAFPLALIITPALHEQLLERAERMSEALGQTVWDYDAEWLRLSEWTLCLTDQALRTECGPAADYLRDSGLPFDVVADVLLELAGLGPIRA